jgi:uncharacterized membrane protein
MLFKRQPATGLSVAINAALIFFILCFALTLHRYWSFSASFDQGIFNQLFWNSVHGRFFESSLSSSLSTNVVHSNQAAEVFYRHLGQHFNPIFVLFMPVYALFPCNETLIFIQVALVTGAGLVLYALARHYLQPMLAAMITISFYCTSTVNGPTMANFHDICAAPLLLFAVLWAMEKRHWALFLLFSILFLGVRQDVGISLFSIGIYMIVSRRFPRMGIITCLLSVGYILLVTQGIMPLFSADVARRMTTERFGQFTGGKEASATEMLLAIATNPMLLLGELFRDFRSKISYVLVHSLALGLVPVISLTTWSAGGLPFLYLFLQRARNALVISIRYAMPVVPGVFYGAIIWWSTRQELFKKQRIRRFWQGCIVLSLLVSIIANPNGTLYFIIPDSIQPTVYLSLPQQWHHVQQLKPLLKKIESDASVSATTQLIPYLSQRRGIVRLPALQLVNDAREVVEVEYLIADLWRFQKYYPAFKGERKVLKNMVALVEQLSSSQKYGIVGFADGVILMQKQTPSDPQTVNSWLAFRQQLPPSILEQLKT